MNVRWGWDRFPKRVLMWGLKKSHRLACDVGGIQGRVLGTKNAERDEVARRRLTEGLELVAGRSGILPTAASAVDSVLVAHRPRSSTLYPELHLLQIPEKILCVEGASYVVLCLAWAAAYVTLQVDSPSERCRENPEVLLACYQAQRDLIAKLPDRAGWLTWVDDTIRSDSRIPPGHEGRG